MSVYRYVYIFVYICRLLALKVAQEAADELERLRLLRIEEEKHSASVKMKEMKRLEREKRYLAECLAEVDSY
jgi:hypothetical protein